MMHHALVAGSVLLQGGDNLQADEAACCASCLNHAACTAWVYCPREGGCAAAGAAANTTLVRRGAGELPPLAQGEARGQLQLPHRGCRLLAIEAFRLRKTSPQILAKGPGVDFVSGALRESTPSRGRRPPARAGHVLSLQAQAGWRAGARPPARGEPGLGRAPASASDASPSHA